MAKTDWEVMRKAAEVMGETAPAGDDPPPPDLGHLLDSGHRRIARRIMIHAGASRPYKMWLPDRFVLLANELAGEGFEVVWCEEGEAPGLDAAVQILKKGGLKEFIQAMAACGMFVGNNSGPMNLANALGIPAVIFSGPSPPKWDPFWHGEKVVNLRLADLACQPCDKISGPVNACRNTNEPMACMKRWSVEEVKRTVVDLWTRHHEGEGSSAAVN
jgi:ADP-heptose:LPS heptosyltransferase